MAIRLIKAEEVRQARSAEKKAVARSAVNDFMQTAQSWVEEFKARKSRPVASPFREEK
jgi:hypothetical protein